MVNPGRNVDGGERTENEDGEDVDVLRRPGYEAGRRFLCELPTHNSLYKA